MPQNTLRAALAALLLAALVATPAGAQERRGATVYGRDGRVQGYAAPMVGSQTDYSLRDRRGNATGSVVREPGGSYAIRDRAGRTTGRIGR